MAREADQATIEGIVQEPVWDWEHFDEVTMDIIENRFSDYSDLKVVVIDTIDELMRMAEEETVRIWNRENPDKRTKSFKATFSGFNGPTDKAIELVTNRLWGAEACWYQSYYYWSYQEDRYHRSCYFGKLFHVVY